MQRKRTAWIVAAVCLLATAAQAKERITANAVKMGTGTRTGYFSVELDRYSTDEERARWREAFTKGGQNALVEAWQDSDVSLGNCRFSQTLGYRIRAAISFDLPDGGRKIIMVTDRPIGGQEIVRNLRTADYPIGWIEVKVDKDGKGEGTLIYAAAFEVENNQLAIKSYGIDPVRLLNVVVEHEKD